MGRRRKGTPITGWLAIDKPAGMTSAHVVAVVRRLTRAARVGHGGTLDPLATGVLPIALGEATKTVAYAMDGLKLYRFTVRWGEARATDDAEGEVTATSPHRPTRAEIEAALPAFLGEIEQIPPIFSAIKVEGRRAYDIARGGETAPELAPRKVKIEEFQLVDMPDADHAIFQVRSGKGTYMRALARDLAKALRTVGHIAQLRRLAVGPFTEKAAISLDSLASLVHSARLAEALLPVATVLDDIPALALTDAEAGRLRHGQPIAALPVASRSFLSGIHPGALVRAMAGDRLVALAEVQGGEIRPVRVIND
ncbi:MAG: tRNA pseudouridine(55) synthase TruB [Alphaproteobacteria bacterium]|nr:tRNA pseudouridine(55) synthase TruB [Alphaproteobacteria bacterium]